MADLRWNSRDFLVKRLATSTQIAGNLATLTEASNAQRKMTGYRAQQQPETSEPVELKGTSYECEGLWSFTNQR